MEVAAIAGLLAVGYALTSKASPAANAEEEGFDTGAAGEQDAAWYGGLPPPIYMQDKTPAGEPTVPGKPRVPRPTADGELDLYYSLPSGGQLPSNPMSMQNLYPRSVVFASPAGPQAPPTAITPQVRMNSGGVEAPPVYNSGRSVISPLSGIAVPAEEFTHNNMVPFYRGSLKQNMTDTGNRSMLDDHVGAGSLQFSKREQAPLFDPHREPTGNITGMESVTDFMQDRVVAPTSRAGEVPVEQVRVGPGLAQGYSSLPIGGFQQLDVDEIAKQRLSIDELRSAANPRITYEGVTITGKSLATQRGEIGETRKYRPDTFYLNENGERNFVTAGENQRPMERAAQVVKFQTREETSMEAMGPAAATEYKATYTVPSFRAPFVHQHDGYGFRNADGSTYGVANTDAPNNDFGKAGVDLPTNQRNVIAERGQALNLVAAGVPSALPVYDPADITRMTVRETTGANDWIGMAAPANAAQKLTVYDPNDVARTTVRETTSANDWVGVAGPAGMAQKLTVYDPTEITRVTTRNTTAEPDRAMNVTRAGMPGKGTIAFPDGMRATTKSAISAVSDYTGTAGAANAKAEQVYDYAYAMRTNPTKEAVAALRKPIAGNGSLAVFNGEDYVNMTYRRLDTDSLNDRSATVDRVVGPPLGTEAIGVQRAKQTLQISVAEDRNIREVLDSLNDNPYAMPVHRIAQGTHMPMLQTQMGPAALAAMSLGSGTGW
jgi:hypothetical protein